MQGLQQFVDLFAGRAGQQNRIIASIANNTIPLAGLRNEIGKLFTPHTNELGSDIGDSIRNRNQLFEYATGTPLPIKYDMLNGKPIREHDFMTRMWNFASPVSLNLDQSPGRKLLFDSGYDLRLSTYYGPDGTDLSESPELRSKFQQLIGQQNLELKLNKLADDPRIQRSIAEMNSDIKKGGFHRSKDPMKAYFHNKKIGQLMRAARNKAWAQLKLDPQVQALIKKARRLELENRRTLQKTQGLILQNK